MVQAVKLSRKFGGRELEAKQRRPFRSRTDLERFSYVSLDMRALDEQTRLFKSQR